jgi:hypothetical protein
MIMRSRAQTIAIILSKYKKKSGARTTREMTSSGEPEIYLRPGDLTNRGGTDVTGKPLDNWTHPEHGNVSGPIAIHDLPDEMYHTTTNLPAVLASGMLRGDGKGGLGGGNGMRGVSFSTNKADALLTQTTLRREILMAQLPPDMTGKTTRSVLEKYARIDEQENFLPPGSLQNSVEFAMGNWDANITQSTHVFDWEKYGGYHDTLLRPQEEIEKNLRSMNHDAHAQYLQARAGDAAKALGLDYKQFKTHPVNQTLKNALILSSGDKVHLLNVEDVGIVTVTKDMLPDGALVRKGSDDFLSEIRVHADIPLASFKMKQKRMT